MLDETVETPFKIGHCESWLASYGYDSSKYQGSTSM